MSISANAYRKALGEQLAAALDNTFKFSKSRLELRAKTPFGEHVIVIAGASKGAPFIDVSFYFGCYYAALKPLEKQLSLQSPNYQASSYHIGQYSPNRHQMKGLPFAGAGKHSWTVNIEKPIDDNMVVEMSNFVHTTAAPFFERFAKSAIARDALANDDPWCIGGNMAWRNVLLLDVSLNDLAHFKQWSSCLSKTDQTQANEMLIKLEALTL
jgi:hypothetical protein